MSRSEDQRAKEARWREEAARARGDDARAREDRWAEELAAREEQRKARRAQRVARWMARAGVPTDEWRPGGGTALTEPVLVMEGVHRGPYVLLGRDDRVVGGVRRTKTRRRGCRESFELIDLDNEARVLAIHIAQRYGREPDVIAAADGTPLLRLHRADASAELSSVYAEAGAALGQRQHRRHVVPPNVLGFTSRLLLDGQRPVGELHLPPGRRWGRTRVITDARGIDAGRVTRAYGSAGPGPTERAFVINIQPGADDRLRAAALLAGVLWDWNILSWEAGGG
jgi:hypothetical protein